jgi:hypothetical protein
MDRYAGTYESGWSNTPHKEEYMWERPTAWALLSDLPPNSRGTSADPSSRTSVPRHTCGSFESHHCATTHPRILRVTPLCHDTPADPSSRTSVPRHTCGPFESHHCATTHLRILRVAPVCHDTPADPSSRTSVQRHTCWKSLRYIVRLFSDIISICAGQWPRGLRHELTWLARTL